MDMQVLGARVSTKGSNAENVVNASGEEHDANVIPTMRLYVQHDNCTRWWPWETDMMRGLPFTVSLMQMMLIHMLLIRKWLDMFEGDQCLNIAILQLWMMFMDEWSSTLGHGSVYGFLEPHSIHNSKDRHVECQHYIETLVKESQQEGPLPAGSFVSYEGCCHLVMYKVFLGHKQYFVSLNVGVGKMQWYGFHQEPAGGADILNGK
ncbi:hypothetical protein JHK87_050573 [Glycine soja]|nr:hypothetical protein JHK87_050573 [Glycine soja]